MREESKTVHSAPVKTKKIDSEEEEELMETVSATRSEVSQRRTIMVAREITVANKVENETVMRSERHETRLQHLEDTLQAKGARQQVARIEDLCNMHVSHRWLHHLDAYAVSVLAPRDFVVNVQKRHRRGRMSSVWNILGFPTGTWRNVQCCGRATRSHYVCEHALLGRLKLADPGKSPETPEVSQSNITDRLILSPPLLSVCVASSHAAAAQGVAAQAFFDGTTSHSRMEIQDLRVQGVVYRPLVWTAGARPHPPVTRTILYAEDIAACLNVQQMSANAFQQRWKHEAQIALFRRRAAMTRAVLPHTSAREQWLPGGLRDITTDQWARAPPLEGGEGDDADAGTNEIILDDDDDIASFSKSRNRHQWCPKPVTTAFAPSAWEAGLVNGTSSVRLGRTVRGAHRWVVHSCLLARCRAHCVQTAESAEGSAHVGTVNQQATRNPALARPSPGESRFQVVLVNSPFSSSTWHRAGLARAKSSFRPCRHGSWHQCSHQAATHTLARTAMHDARPLGRLRRTIERCTSGYAAHVGESSHSSGSFPSAADLL